MSFKNSIRWDKLYERTLDCLGSQLCLWDLAFVKDISNVREDLHLEDKQIGEFQESLEEALNISLNSIEFRKCQTIKEIVDLLEEKENERNDRKL